MIVGTAGHIDHGKTSLVKALSGVDTDRLKEEKARGITIDLGFAYVPAGEGHVLGFVDVPGHERFVHTMLAGASGIDMALLVVAADDGPMPQTSEHLAILDLLGVERGIVALSKADLVSPERLAEVTAEIDTLLEPTGLAGSPVVPVSTLTGEGVAELKARLIQAEQDFVRARTGGRFRLAVDRCFTLQGAGTVVTGTVLSGAVSVGDRVLVSPSALPARVRSIHAQNRPAERGVAGQRCALNLVGEAISKEAIHRGDVVLDPALHAPTDRIDADLRVLPSERKAIGHWFPVRLHHHAAEVGARIALLGEHSVRPGGTGRVQLVLDTPIAATVGDRYVIRDVSAQRTIGGGRLLDLRPPARKRRTAERLAQLDALTATDPAAALSALLDIAPFWVDVTTFMRDRALSEEQSATLLAAVAPQTLPGDGRVIALSPAQWQRFSATATETLERFHAEAPDVQGLGREKLRSLADPKLPPDGVAAALQMLARAGLVSIEGAFVRLPTHEVRLTEADEEIWRELFGHLGDGERFRPPRVRDLAGLLAVPEGNVRRVLKLCARLGRVDEIAHDHFFLRATTREMVGIAMDVAGKTREGQFNAALFRDRMNNGRKVAIQILEFFDHAGLTLRRGDLRRLNPQALDLFGATEAVGIERSALPHGQETTRPDP
ncbi:selenocysteine-specific translation elongation factor SelB [Faunimonas pinastri]|uniref:Selenocysteine-specific elongation factor n=1 Tax=Faunimonas pinastri TaxID=1855383 RepID=A0A1H9NKC8_9HYPH|nr:selenocysteine-specific translation elongation factor [Faunimonas pinastri]SER35843.1 selenocysteine-specific translation elongation factor SelB [Faunimonas pinastri]